MSSHSIGGVELPTSFSRYPHNLKLGSNPADATSIKVGHVIANKGSMDGQTFDTILGGVIQFKIPNLHIKSEMYDLLVQSAPNYDASTLSENYKPAILQKTIVEQMLRLPEELSSFILPRIKNQRVYSGFRKGRPFRLQREDTLESVSMSSGSTSPSPKGWYVLEKDEYM